MEKKLLAYANYWVWIIKHALSVQAVLHLSVAYAC